MKIKTTAPIYSDGSLILIDEDREYIRPITPFEINQNPNIIRNRMNSRDCECYIEKYNGQRGKHVPLVRKRLSEIVNAKKQRDRNFKKTIIEQKKQLKEEELYFKFTEWVKVVSSRVKFHHQKIKELSPNICKIPNRKVQIVRDVARRDLGEALKELPYQYTGLISVNALTQKLKNKSFIPTSEHIFPRTGVGFDLIVFYDVMLKMKGSCSARELIPIIYQSCFVNKTTEEENLVKLKPFQTEQTFNSPEIAYEKANIVLVQEQKCKIHHRWARISKESEVKLIDPPKFKNVITMEEFKKL